MILTKHKKAVGFILRSILLMTIGFLISYINPIFVDWLISRISPAAPTTYSSRVIMSESRLEPVNTEY